jgi:hypothetical protein
MSTLALDPRRRPNLLGIGAAKCGTTWLATVLSAHPDIFMPAQKELNALHYGDLDARLAEYEAYFAPARDEKIRCDFSVRYLNSQNAPRAAARYTSDAMLLLVLRDPVEQVQSHYWHLLRQNFHEAHPVRPAPTIFEAIERYPHLLLEPALYGKHLACWLEHFPRERLHVMRQEELMRRLPVVMDGLMDFLGIARFDFAAASAATSSSGGRGGVRPRKGALGAVYPVLYAAAANGPMRWLKSSLGVRRTDAIKRGLGLRQISEAVFFSKGYEKLDATGRARLGALFRRDTELLSRLVDIDVSSWARAA